MDKEKYIKEIFNFHRYNFYLKKTPLEMYDNEKLGIKCAVFQSEDYPNEVMLASAGRPLVREYEPPVEVVLFTTKEIMEDKEKSKVVKQFFEELLEKEYEDHFNGSISYPGLFKCSKEFEKQFGKTVYALQIRNGGDPVFLELDDEDRVVFVVAPMFFTKEEFEEYNNIKEEEDEDEADNYLYDLDEEEDCSTLK